MIRGLLILSLVLWVLSIALFFSTSFIPFRVYFLEVQVNSKTTASKIYRDIQDYIKSLDKDSQKYIHISNIIQEKRVIVKEDYSKIVLSIREEEKFLKEKLKKKLEHKGYRVNIIPYEGNFYFAYLSDFVFLPQVKLTSSEVDNINKKYVEYLQEEKLLDYIKFLNSYFNSSDSERIARTQFYISKNFVINFTISPYTTSKKMDLSIIKISNITKKEYFVNFQKIFQKYKNSAIYLNIKEDEKLVNLKFLSQLKR